MANYYEDKRVSSTEIRTLATQGARGLVNYLTTESEPTPAMIFGTLVHALVLEPGEVVKRYYTMPKIDGRTKEGKEAKAKALAEAGDKTIVDEETFARAQAVAREVSPFVGGAALETGDLREAEFYTETCKAKPDAVDESAGTVFDIKTTAAFDTAPKTVWTLRYDLQAGHYCNVLAANGVNVEKFVFVFAETTAPFRVREIIFAGDVLALAKREAEMWAIDAQAVKVKEQKLEEVAQDTPEIYASYPDWVRLQTVKTEEEF